jgi:uncharacterized protein (TIGR02217 family)
MPIVVDPVVFPSGDFENDLTGSALRFVVDIHQGWRGRSRRYLRMRQGQWSISVVPFSKYNIPAYITNLRSFYAARRGPLRGFLFKDPDDSDIAHTDGVIGEGTGAAQQLQISKAYTDGAGDVYLRPIYFFPTPTNIEVRVNGGVVGGWSITGQGVLNGTFASGGDITVSAPLFYTPVRFDNNSLDYDHSGDEEAGIVRIPTVRLMELV